MILTALKKIFMCVIRRQGTSLSRSAKPKASRLKLGKSYMPQDILSALADGFGGRVSRVKLLTVPTASFSQLMDSNIPIKNIFYRRKKNWQLYFDNISIATFK